MEASQPWNDSLAESFYNPATSVSVSSYFMRPSKIVKSSSRNTSPRTMGRRKTTTAATASSRTRSVVDNLRSAAQWQHSETDRSRPVSWHPGSIDGPLNMPFNVPVNGTDLSAWSFSTVQVNGLVTPMTYPVMNEPQIREVCTPLDELPYQDVEYTSETRLYHDQPWANPDSGKPNAYSFPMVLQQQTSSQPSWQFDQHVMGPSVHTAPSSPATAPIQNIGLGALSLNAAGASSKDDAEELVGMGLYDSPAEVQSSSLLFGGSSWSGRRALKLEESFVPVECDEEDEDAEAEEDEEDDAPQESVVDADDTFPAWGSVDRIDAQSATNHLTFGTQPQPDSLASRYLATLRQLNSAYYPTGYPGYGFI